MKIKLSTIAILLIAIYSNAQSQLELAEKYLDKRGELVFSFTANNKEEIKQLSKIISFDHHQDTSNPLKVNAIANRKGFNRFKEFNLPFEVNIKANEPKNVIMYDQKIHGKNTSGKSTAYTLTFPLTAYPTYNDYVAQMNAFASDHSDIAELVDIGNSINGRDLLFIKLSDNVGTREAEPRIMYISSIHGDELAGYPMMLSLIDYLITAYKDTGHVDHARAVYLINNAEIWINPLANPDGTYTNNNSTVSGATRGNANGIDMNRNYPEPEGSLHPDGEVYQAETLAYMALADSYHFVLSANFHGGAEVANYPWDFTYDRHIDNDWLIHISKEYADNAQADGPGGYFTSVTSTGYTHGADWYLIAGGRQDYQTYDKHGREVTMEVSDTKLIPASEIQNHWNYNREALLDYLMQGTYGFKGIVKDASTNIPIDAKITIVGRDDQALSRNSWAQTELPLGDFYRPIEAGVYDILIEADCYESVIYKNQSISNYETIDLGIINMNEINSTSTLSNLNTSPVSTTTATLNWNSVLNATNYDIRYREVGASTWTNDNSTSNSLNISGLTASTQYEFQVRVTCNSSTSLYSSSKNFTTTSSGTIISSFSYNQSFENTLGYWSQGVNGSDDDIDWDIDSNGTPSNNTGPSSASNGAYYLFTEASTNVTPQGSPDKYAYLNSPYFDFTGFINPTFSFDYHWYGTNIDQATLVVEISNDGGNSFNQIFTHPSPGTSSNVWQSSGSIDLSAYNGDVVTFRIIGKTGDGWSSDMAIDNIVITAEADASLGIQDELLSQFVLYPNPSKGEINLNLPQEIVEFNVEVSNMMGQKVYTEEVKLYGTNKHSFNLRNVNAGVYFVKISTNLGKASKKIIIE